MSLPSWPNGARVAVLVSVLLEAWSEGKAPGYFPRTTPLKAGQVDHAAARWSEYGGKEGIWRLIRILDERGIHASVFANALAAQRYPEAIRQIVRSGHRVEGHGYAQNQYLMDLPPEEQQATIRRCLDILEEKSGRRPEGWMTPVYGGDQHTTELLVREGLQWHCDALDRSLPQRETTASGSIIAIPWSEFVDNRVLRSSPQDYFDVYQSSFIYHYEQESLGLIHLACHSHFGGRPQVAAVLDKILRYFSGYSGVWYPTPGELAQWMRETGRDVLPYAERFDTGEA